MLLPDVNVLVYAHREDLAAHPVARAWLESALNGDEPLGVFNPTLARFFGIVTNRRIFKTPTPLSLALDFVETLRAAPMARPIHTSASHFSLEPASPPESFRGYSFIRDIRGIRGLFESVFLIGVYSC